MTLYAARVGRYVKIGHSTNAARRVKVIKSDDCGKPVDLDRSQPVEMLGTREGDLSTEGVVHDCLHMHRIAGEWFADCPIVHEVIDGWEYAIHGEVTPSEPTVTCADHATEDTWYGGRYAELAEANAMHYLAKLRARNARKAGAA